MKKKINTTTFLLFSVIVALMVAVFYISYVLTGEKGEISPTVPRKTKASSTTYRKFIALGQTFETAEGELPTSTPTTEPTVATSPTQAITPTGVVSLTPIVTSVVTGQPTPTEIIIAYQSLTGTPSSALAYGSATATPTGVSSLVASGFIQNALIIFAVSGLFIFLSFLF